MRDEARLSQPGPKAQMRFPTDAPSEQLARACWCRRPDSNRHEVPSTVFETVASTIPPLRRQVGYNGARAALCPGRAGRAPIQERTGVGTWEMKLERKTGFEPTTFSLARRPLPLSHFRPRKHRPCSLVPRPRLELGTQHFQCCALPTELPRPVNPCYGAAWTVSTSRRATAVRLRGALRVSRLTKVSVCLTPSTMPTLCAGTRRGLRSSSDSPR